MNRCGVDRTAEGNHAEQKDILGSDKLTDEQAHDLVSQLEPDRSGLINYSEYVNMMMSD